MTRGVWGESPQEIHRLLKRLEGRLTIHWGESPQTPRASVSSAQLLSVSFIEMWVDNTWKSILPQSTQRLGPPTGCPSNQSSLQGYILKVKGLAEKGDWLRAARYVTSVKKSKGTVPVPFFSGPSPYGLAHRKRGTGTERVSESFPTIWPNTWKSILPQACNVWVHSPVVPPISRPNGTTY